jgi:hypothetical protein
MNKKNNGERNENVSFKTTRRKTVKCKKQINIFQ